MRISAEIEGTRLRAKRAISEAEDFAEIDAILASVGWGEKEGGICLIS